MVDDRQSLQELFKQQLEEDTNAEGRHRMAFALWSHPDNEITNQMVSGSREQPWEDIILQTPLIHHRPVDFDESGHDSPSNISSHGEHIESFRATARPEAPKTSWRESSVQEERRQTPQGTPLCSPSSSLKLVGHSGSEEKTQPENFFADGEVELVDPGLPFHRKQVSLPDVVDSPSPSDQDVLMELEEHLVSQVIEEGPPRVISNRSPLELGNYAQMSYSEGIDIRQGIPDDREPASMVLLLCLLVGSNKLGHFSLLQWLRDPNGRYQGQIIGKGQITDRRRPKCRKLAYCGLRHDCTTAFYCKRKQQTLYLQPGPAYVMDGPHCAKGDAIPPGHAFDFTFRPEGVGEASPPRNEGWTDRPDSPVSDDIDNDCDPISPNLTLEDPGSVGGAEPTASVGDNHTDPTEDNAPAISCTLLAHQLTVNAEVEEQDLSSQKIKDSSFKEDLNSLASRNRLIEAGSPVQMSGLDCMDKKQDVTDGADPAITNTSLQPSGVVEGLKRLMSGGDHLEAETTNVLLAAGWSLPSTWFSRQRSISDALNAAEASHDRHLLTSLYKIQLSRIPTTAASMFQPTNLVQRILTGFCSLSLSWSELRQNMIALPRQAICSDEYHNTICIPATTSHWINAVTQAEKFSISEIGHRIKAVIQHLSAQAPRIDAIAGTLKSWMIAHRTPAIRRRRTFHPRYGAARAHGSPGGRTGDFVIAELRVRLADGPGTAPWARFFKEWHTALHVARRGLDACMTGPHVDMRLALGAVAAEGVNRGEAPHLLVLPLVFISCSSLVTGQRGSHKLVRTYSLFLLKPLLLASPILREGNMDRFMSRRIEDLLPFEVQAQ
ncbi:hypothetical protein B0H11DRAFT_1932161 [Mycena galericulata]|nr:hypothetical protein B0H11DRAFT_1932161 [Mycena galericulata]